MCHVESAHLPPAQFACARDVRGCRSVSPPLRGGRRKSWPIALPAETGEQTDDRRASLSVNLGASFAVREMNEKRRVAGVGRAESWRRSLSWLIFAREFKSSNGPPPSEQQPEHFGGNRVDRNTNTNADANSNRSENDASSQFAQIESIAFICASNLINRRRAVVHY